MTKNSKKQFIFYALIILAITFLLRLPSFWTPIMDVDESEFAEYAMVLLNGGVPYLDSVDTKPLGIYWFYMIIFKIFGDYNMIAVHLVTALWVSITGFFCYRIAKRFYSNRAGFFAALFYVVFTTAYYPKFIATSMILIMMLPITMSIDFFLRGEERGKKRYMWLAGLLWGIGCLFKYQAGINLILIGFYLLIFKPLYDPKTKISTTLKHFGMYFLGGAIIGALFLFYVYAIGAWDAFWFWSFSGSLAYVEAGSRLTRFWISLATRGGSIIACNLLLVFLAAWKGIDILHSIFRTSRRKHLKSEETLILLWFLFSIIPVCAGGKFYGHYFLQLFPQMSILAAASACRIHSWYKTTKHVKRRRTVFALLLAGILIPTIGSFAARIYAAEIYAAVGEEDPDEYRTIARYISGKTSSNDKIFVWGFAAPIYFFSERLPASRFLWTDWQTGRVSGTPSAKDIFYDTTPFITKGSWEMLFEDLDKHEPVYFIDTSPGNHHDYIKYPIKKYGNLNNYLNDNYILETSIGGADLYRRK